LRTRVTFHRSMYICHSVEVYGVYPELFICWSARANYFCWGDFRYRRWLCSLWCGWLAIAIALCWFWLINPLISVDTITATITTAIEFVSFKLFCFRFILGTSFFILFHIKWETNFISEFQIRKSSLCIKWHQSKITYVGKVLFLPSNSHPK
jgi:hypothetical protein